MPDGTPFDFPADSPIPDPINMPETAAGQIAWLSLPVLAPRHGFDRSTLSALHKEGIELLSDGFARVAFLRGGLTWIPQQLWEPVVKSRGLWTICVHSNSATDAQVSQLSAFLSVHAAQFTSVERVLAELAPGKLSPAERFREALALWRVQASKARKQRMLRSVERGKG